MELAGLLPYVGDAVDLWQLGPLAWLAGSALVATESHRLGEQLGQLVHVILDLLLGHWSLGYLHGLGELDQPRRFDSLLDEGMATHVNFAPGG